MMVAHDLGLHPSNVETAADTNELLVPALFAPDDTVIDHLKALQIPGSCILQVKPSKSTNSYRVCLYYSFRTHVHKLTLLHGQAFSKAAGPYRIIAPKEPEVKGFIRVQKRKPRGCGWQKTPDLLKILAEGVPTLQRWICSIVDDIRCHELSEGKKTRLEELFKGGNSSVFIVSKDRFTVVFPEKAMVQPGPLFETPKPHSLGSDDCLPNRHYKLIIFMDGDLKWGLSRAYMRDGLSVLGSFLTQQDLIIRTSFDDTVRAVTSLAPQRRERSLLPCWNSKNDVQDQKAQYPCEQTNTSTNLKASASVADSPSSPVDDASKAYIQFFGSPFVCRIFWCLLSDAIRQSDRDLLNLTFLPEQYYGFRQSLCGPGQVQQKDLVELLRHLARCSRNRSPLKCLCRAFCLQATSASDNYSLYFSFRELFHGVIEFKEAFLEFEGLASIMDIYRKARGFTTHSTLSDFLYQPTLRKRRALLPSSLKWQNVSEDKKADEADSSSEWLWKHFEYEDDPLVGGEDDDTDIEESEAPQRNRLSLDETTPKITPDGEANVPLELGEVERIITGSKKVAGPRPRRGSSSQRVFPITAELSPFGKTPALMKQNSMESTGRTSQYATSSRSSMSDEEAQEASPNIYRKPAVPLMNVPRLSIINSADVESPAGHGPGDWSSRYNSNVSSPYTTRSSRRYNHARITSTVAEMYQAKYGIRIPMSLFGTLGLTRESSSDSTTPNRTELIRIQQLRRKVSGDCVAITDTPLSLVGSLAKRLGQSYLASDLWAIMEMRQRQELMTPQIMSSGQRTHKPKKSVSQLRLTSMDENEALSSALGSASLHYWIMHTTSSSPFYVPEIIEEYLLQEKRPVCPELILLTKLLVDLASQDCTHCSAKDFGKLMDLFVSELVWSQEFASSRRVECQMLSYELKEGLLKIMNKATFTKFVLPGKPKSRPTVPGLFSPNNKGDAFIEHLDFRMSDLSAVGDRVERHRRSMSPEEWAKMRKSYILQERFVSSERNGIAKHLAWYLEKTTSRGNLTWAIIRSLLKFSFKLLNSLGISNPNSREGYQTPPTVLCLEEAMLVHWLFKASSYVFNFCGCHLSAGLHLIEEIVSVGQYTNFLNNCLQYAVFELSVEEKFESAMKDFQGSSDSLSFCGEACIMAIRRQVVEHLDRCVEICRSSWHQYDSHLGPCHTPLGDKSKIGIVALLLKQLHGLITKIDLTNLHYFIAQNSLESPHTDFNSAVHLLWTICKLLAIQGDTQSWTREWVETMVTFHFTSVLKLYRSAPVTEENLVLCKMHLRILLSLATSSHQLVRNKIFQLRIMHFFTQEISPEMHVSNVNMNKSAEASPVQDCSVPASSCDLSWNYFFPKAPSFSQVLSLKPISESSQTSEPEVCKEVRQASPIPEATKHETFSEGDRVDGRVIMKNGRQRWFPGVITKVAEGGGFSLRYDDGDTEDGKMPCDLRPSMSRKKSGAAENGPLVQRTIATISSSRAIATEETTGRSSVENEGRQVTSNLNKTLPTTSDQGNSTQGSVSEVQEPANPLSDDDSDDDSDGILDIPACLIPQTRAFQPSASLLAMKLNLKDANLFLSHSSANNITPSLSSSILMGCVGEDTVSSACNDVGDCILGDLGSLSLEREKSENGYWALWYANQRKQVPLYLDSQLHELVVLLIISLCVSEDNVTLDQRYCTQLPLADTGGYRAVGFNVLYALYCHINHPGNKCLLPAIQCHIQQFGRAAMRLWRLLCEGGFDQSLYRHDVKEVAKGNFGTVVAVRNPVPLKNDGESTASVLAVKYMNHEHGPHDRCVTFDFFSEISTMEILQGSPHICQVFDYGVSDGRFCIVMEHCPYSLKAWRDEHISSELKDADVVLCLNIFSKVLEAVQTLHDQNIAHFDLKCDNILLRKITDKDPELLEDEGHGRFPFTICISDFGEAQIFTGTYSEESDQEMQGQGRRMLQARGTEAVQSPEMLRIVASAKSPEAQKDRRKNSHVGCSSDVWSLG